MSTATRPEPFSREKPCSRILIVRLPCGKVYPAGPVYLASLLRRALPSGTAKTDAGERAVRILDLAADGLEGHLAARRLAGEIAAFRPELVAFSWRDLQVFSPQDSDSGFRDAFSFLHDPSPLGRLAAAFRGAAEVFSYKTGISRNLALIAGAARGFPSVAMALGGPAARIFGGYLGPRLPPRVRLFSESELGPFFAYLGLELPENPIEPGLDLGFLETAFPQWRDYRDMTVGVQTKRGCPRDCLYCVYPKLEGREALRRRPEAVAAEIEAYARRWGIRHFWLVDAQLLSVPEDGRHLEALLARIEAMDLGIRWSGYLRVSDVDARLAGVMVRSGLEELEVSIGSGSQRIVDGLRLGFTIDEALRGLGHLKAAGYEGRVLVNLSLNAPGETRESLAETLAVVDRIRALFGAERVLPVVFFLAIQPGTGLEALALAEGRLRPGYNPLSIWPWRAQKLIYNPAPLGAMIGRACAEAFRSAPEGSPGAAPSSRGDRILAAIKREL